jgi:hypothetical protein
MIFSGVLVGKNHPSPVWSSTKDMLMVTESLSIKGLISPLRVLPSRWGSYHKGNSHQPPCTGLVDIVFTTEPPTKEGSPHPPNTVIVATPNQARGSLTYRRATKTPRGRHTKTIAVVHSKTKHKAATYCSLTFSWPNLTLTLTKHVLKLLDVIT